MFASEAAGISSLCDLQSAMAAIGALRLLYGQSPLLRMIGDVQMAGAPSSTVAKATLTRGARARERRRRLQIRSHNAAAFMALLRS